jgi:hypothetical protein
MEKKHILFADDGKSIIDYSWPNFGAFRLMSDGCA